MKKLLLFLTAFLSCMLITENVKAEQQVTLDTLDNYTEDLEQIRALENDIINQINMARRMNDKSALPKEFKPDYTKAYKIYVDTDIFALENNNSNDIVQLLNQGNYVWSLFVEYNGDYYTVDISKGLPLREETAHLLTQDEINEINAKEGKWTVSCVSVLEYDMSYKNKIAGALKNTQYNTTELEFVLCGGLKFIHYPVAVAMYNGNAELIIPLYQLEIEGTSKEKAAAIPAGAAEGDNVYLYNSIKNAVNRMKLTENQDESLTGEGGFINLSETGNVQESVKPKEKSTNPVYIYLIVGGIFLIAAVGGGVVIFKKNARRVH